MNRLILKFCTQSPVLNHAKKKKRQKRHKAIIHLVYNRRNNMDGQRALSWASRAIAEE